MIDYSKPQVLEGVVVDEHAAQYAEWVEAKEALDAWKAVELTRRAAFIEALFGSKTNTEQMVGSCTVKFADGKKFGVTFKMNEKLNPDGVDVIRSKIGDARADKLFRVKVELVSAVRKALADDEVDLLNDFIVRTPATPSLAVK